VVDQSYGHGTVQQHYGLASAEHRITQSFRTNQSRKPSLDFFLVRRADLHGRMPGVLASSTGEQRFEGLVEVPLQFKPNTRNGRRLHTSVRDHHVIAVPAEGLEAERVDLGAAEAECGRDMQARDGRHAARTPSVGRNWPCVSGRNCSEVIEIQRIANVLEPPEPVGRQRFPSMLLRMQEREHRPRSCDDSTRRCDSQAGRYFRKGQVKARVNPAGSPRPGDR
jgi:hypothetical protein